MKHTPKERLNLLDLDMFYFQCHRCDFVGTPTTDKASARREFDEFHNGYATYADYAADLPEQDTAGMVVDWETDRMFTAQLYRSLGRRPTALELADYLEDRGAVVTQVTADRPGLAPAVAAVWHKEDLFYA